MAKVLGSKDGGGERAGGSGNGGKDGLGKGVFVFEVGSCQFFGGIGHEQYVVIVGIGFFVTRVSKLAYMCVLLKRRSICKKGDIVRLASVMVSGS
jgi:hypothetical protein